MRNRAPEAGAPPAASQATPLAPAFAETSTLAMVIVFVLALAHGALYASIVPPWQAPDEPKHFEYVALLYETRQLLSRELASVPIQTRIVESMREHDFWRFGFGNPPSGVGLPFQSVWPDSPTVLDRPPLYYVLALPVYALMRNGDISSQLYALRLFSVFLGGTTVLVAFLLAREIFPGDPFVGFGAAAFVALLPQYTFVSGSINSDNLANLVAATTIWILVRCLRTGLSASSAFLLLGLLLAGFWTKRTTLFLFPLSLVAIGLYVVRGRVRLERPVLGAGLGALVVGGLALQLDPVQGLLRWVLDRYVFNYSMETNLTLFAGRDYRPETLYELYSSFFWGLLESFWGRFGWMNVRLHVSWYHFSLALTLLAVAGLALLLVRALSRPEYLDRRQKAALLLCGAAAALVAGVAFAQYTAEFRPKLVPQGRYLFPALLPIAMLHLAGMRELATGKRRWAILFAFLAALFIMDAQSIGTYMAPLYYR